eukprot:2810945-Rhodomonas_salina.2
MVERERRRARGERRRPDLDQIAHGMPGRETWGRREGRAHWFESARSQFQSQAARNGSRRRSGS